MLNYTCVGLCRFYSTLVNMNMFMEIRVRGNKICFFIVFFILFGSVL